MQQKITDSAFELGTQLGRRQAFTMVAGRCSAAEAQCLQNIREKKQFLALGMNWGTFCKEQAGISRSQADKLIRQLEEFGPGFFTLAAVTGITAAEYRGVSSAVTEQGLLHAGEAIAIVPENASRLTAAIEQMRQQADPPESADPLPSPVERSFVRFEKMLKGAFAELDRLQSTTLNMGDRLRLQSELGSGIDKLRRYAADLHI